MESKIIELLYQHDCVVLPNLGAFLSVYHPAEIDKFSNTMRPPRKTPAFNEILTADDGILTQHIVSTEKISENEAKNKIDEFVKQIWTRLRIGEKVHLLKLGDLYLQQDKLIFTPDPNANFLLDSLGMNPIELPQEKKQTFSSTTIPPNSSETKVKTNISTTTTKKSNTGWWIAATILALLIIAALILFPTKLYKRLPFFAKNDSKETLTAEQVEKIKQDSIIAANKRIADSLEALNNNKKRDTTNNKATTDNTKPKKDTTTNVDNLKVDETSKYRTDKFHIVIGSFKSQENAERLKKEISKTGFATTILPANQDGYFRVTVGGQFNSASEAIASYKKFHSSHSDKQAWMLKPKK